MKETPGRILAVDYGSRRVGVALSDPLRVLAGGLATLGNDDTIIQRLTELIREHQATQVVVGIPYGEQGELTPKAQEVMAFIQRLRKTVPVPVETWDESFTSVEAHRAFRMSGMKQRKRREKDRVDTMAARILLQEYLDHLASRPQATN
jgi:putative Holliday junction resolvase